MSEPTLLEARPGSSYAAGGPPRGLRGARARTAKESAIGGVLFAAGAISILTTIGIIAVLVWESAAFFRRVSITEFLTGTVWTPLFTPQHFGVLPLLAGSLLVALVAA
ncbi:MAG TPA: phosphate ABC transporter permease subunit PstC, partial [Gemmatimonadota bacterium]|nr:phosphate ABC transporter permease subunit PstC [Gemmatimonadota bacterium]